jgi:hypothetical protein
MQSSAAAARGINACILPASHTRSHYSYTVTAHFFWRPKDRSQGANNAAFAICLTDTEGAAATSFLVIIISRRSGRPTGGT